MDNQSFLSSSYYFLYFRELFVLFRVTLLEKKNACHSKGLKSKELDKLREKNYALLIG